VFKRRTAVVRKLVDEETPDDASAVQADAVDKDPPGPVDIFVTPGAGLRALRERIKSSSKRGPMRLTRALALLEAEYERVSKATAPAADDAGSEE
jgi:hypothetical protein